MWKWKLNATIRGLWVTSKVLQSMQWKLHLLITTGTIFVKFYVFAKNFFVYSYLLMLRITIATIRTKYIFVLFVNKESIINCRIKEAKNIWREYWVHTVNEGLIKMSTQISSEQRVIKMHPKVCIFSTNCNLNFNRLWAAKSFWILNVRLRDRGLWIYYAIFKQALAILIFQAITENLNWKKGHHA